MDSRQTIAKKKIENRIHTKEQEMLRRCDTHTHTHEPHSEVKSRQKAFVFLTSRLSRAACPRFYPARRRPASTERCGRARFIHTARERSSRQIHNTVDNSLIHCPFSTFFFLNLQVLYFFFFFFCSAHKLELLQFFSSFVKNN